MARPDPQESKIVPYPRGLRLMAFALIFIASTQLFQLTGALIDTYSEGIRSGFVGALLAVILLAALLVVAVGLFWFKEWARKAAIPLLALLGIRAALAVVFAPRVETLFLHILTMIAAVAVIYHLRRPHVRNYFALQR